jgi:hypothetical protein
MTRPLTALLLLAAALALPAIAHADRAPTRAEAARIAEVAGAPPRCLKIRVSTVNSRWASAYRRNLRRGCRRYQADGVAVFRRRSSGWRFVVAGSAFECPVPKVPKAVVRDLGIRCYPDA